MPARPYSPPKFVSFGRPYRSGHDLRVASFGSVQEHVLQDGVAHLKRNREDETVYVYQLVAVAKPKPVEFVVEEFAVCKAVAKPAAKKAAVVAEKKAS